LPSSSSEGAAGQRRSTRSSDPRCVDISSLWRAAGIAGRLRVIVEPMVKSRVWCVRRRVIVRGDGSGGQSCGGAYREAISSLDVVHAGPGMGWVRELRCVTTVKYVLIAHCGLAATL
jgi:hypothetical protein